MTDEDPVLARLAALPDLAPDPVRSRRLREAGHARLRPRRLRPVWVLLVAGSTFGYLGGAFYFAAHLF